ncbi:hypothetical protein DFH27DRAFT_524181 [Peziza echinospora]|nr:hypothetical protein DFH27DRAFT_524181 [Peziza echinospora]
MCTEVEPSCKICNRKFPTEVIRCAIPQCSSIVRNMKSNIKTCTTCRPPPPTRPFWAWTGASAAAYNQSSGSAFQGVEYYHQYTSPAAAQEPSSSGYGINSAQVSQNSGSSSRGAGKRLGSSTEQRGYSHGYGEAGSSASGSTSNQGSGSEWYQYQDSSSSGSYYQGSDPAAYQTSGPSGASASYSQKPDSSDAQDPNTQESSGWKY